MKKGILYTILVIFMIGSLMTAGMALLKRAEEHSYIISGTSLRSTMTRIPALIGSDYEEIFNINNISLDEVNGIVKHSIFISPTKKDPLAILDDYNAYLKEIYGPRLNMNISSNLTESFEIEPYNSIVILGQDNYTIFLDEELIDSIIINLKVNKSFEEFEGFTRSDRAGDKSFSINLKGTGNEEFSSYSRNIDISRVNTYVFQFNSSGRPVISLNLSSLVLKLTVGLETYIDVSYDYDSAGKNTIFLNIDGQSNLASIDGRMAKSSDILLTAD